MRPKWADLATDLQGKIKVAKINCPDAKDICDAYNVASREYPSLKFFHRGDKYLVKPIDFVGK